MKKLLTISILGVLSLCAVFGVYKMKEINEKVEIRFMVSGRQATVENIINMCIMTQANSYVKMKGGLWKRFYKEDVRDCMGEDVGAAYDDNDRAFWCYDFRPREFQVEGDKLYVIGRRESGLGFVFAILASNHLEQVTEVLVREGN